MLELAKEIEWSDYVEILTYGYPPVYVQLLLAIGLTFAILLYRTIARKRPMTKGNKFKNKVFFVMMIGLILFQEKLDLRGMMDTIGF